MIRYEPPAPVAPNVAAAYGAAQEFNKMAPVIQGARNAQAGLNLQAGIAAANAYQRGVDTSTQRGIAAGQQATQIGMQQQAQAFQLQENNQRFAQQAALQYAQQEQQAAAIRFQAEQQQVLQQQRIWSEVEAERVKLSQADQLLLQRYRNSDTWIDEQLGEGLIAPETAFELKAQVRKLKGNLEFREQAAKVQQIEASTKAEEQRTGYFAQKQVELKEFEARQFPKTTGVAQDPAVRAQVISENFPKIQAIRAAMGDAAAEAFIEGEVGKRDGHLFFYQSEPGRWTQAKVDRAGRADDQNALPKGALTESAFIAKQMQVIRAVDKEIARQVKDDPDGAGKQWLMHPEWRDIAIANDMRRSGIPPTYDEYVASSQGQGQPRPIAQPFTMPGATGGQPAPTPHPGQAQQGQSVADDGPITVDKPLSDGQKQQFAAIDSQRSAINRAPIPPEQKQELIYGTVALEKLLIRYGSIRNLEQKDPEAYKKMLELADRIDKLPQPPRVQEDRGPAGAIERFGRGELVTVDVLKDKLEKFKKGELVTSDDILNLFK